ncbi:MAG: SMP-30/gluconolactonase/LRE family protein [Actinomycetota bacterium]|nr:hypothetical protein [Actinomycetota bacterium]
MKTLLRSILVAAVLIASAAMPSASPAQGLTQEKCAGTETLAPTVWKSVGDVLENLLFADGSIWISDSTAGKIRRFDHAGNEGTGLAVASPGGLAEAPDGTIFGGAGDGLPNALTRAHLSKVIRFSPTNPAGYTTVGEGFNMVNGLTLSPGGDLYFSNDVDYGLMMIPSATTTPGTPAELAHIWGTNGLVIDPAGQNLYANITFDQRSPIERIPLAAPGTHATVAQLSLGVVSLEPNVYGSPDTDAPLLGVKGLDDITRDAAGNLYPVANGTGELLRVNPATGAACLITGGLQNPSSVRIAPEGSAFSDLNPATLDFYITEFSGNVRIVRYVP